MRILKSHPILIILDSLINLPTPSNISYLWNFGFLLGMVLVIQLGTGIFLAMHYCSHVDLAFISVEHIMRDINYGWFLRYAHANGAAFFLSVFIFIWVEDYIMDHIHHLDQQYEVVVLLYIYLWF